MEIRKAFRAYTTKTRYGPCHAIVEICINTAKLLPLSNEEKSAILPDPERGYGCKEKNISKEIYVLSDPAVLPEVRKYR